MDTSISFSLVSSSCVGWFNWQTVITFRYAHHPVFMFVVYDIIHRRKVALGYSLLIKSGMWEKTEKLICKIIHAQLIAVATKIKETNRSIDAAILVLEQYIKTITAHTPHLYTRCFQFRIQLKALMVANGILIFWIIFNSTDLRYSPVICLVSI